MVHRAEAAGMTLRRLVLGSIVLAAVGVGAYFAVAALSGGGSVTQPTPGGSQDTTMITDISFVLDLSWSPPEALPAGDEQTIRTSLGYYGVEALFPSPVPVVTGGPFSAGLWLTRTIPTNHISVSVLVRGADGQPILSVTSGDSTWAGSDDWSRVDVRGQPGRFYDNGAGVKFLAWQEAERTYSVDFGRAISLEQVVAWLGSWYRLP
jgi:hypothetical protein